MIQPIKRAATEWSLCWIELAEPLPVEGDFFLPTFLILVKDGWDPVVPPEIIEEPDQVLAEEWVARVFEEHGAPDRLQVWSAEEWNDDEWRSFGRDWKVKVRVVKPPLFEEQIFEQLQSAAHTDAVSIPAEATRRDIARGLVRSARRMKSVRKRRASLERAVEIDPGCALARVELAEMDFHRGKYEESLSAAEEIIHMESRWFSQPRVHWWIDSETRPLLRAMYGAMMCKWHLGQYEEAAGVGDRILEILPEDHLGVRFTVPLLRLQAGDQEEASAFFRWYEQRYRDDLVQPSLFFAWGYTLCLDGDDQGARQKYRAGMLSNLYIAPRLLGFRGPPEDIYHPTERDDPQFATDFATSFGGLWDRDASAMRILRETYEEMQPVLRELIAMRARLADFLDQRYEPAFKERWMKLVQEDEAFVRSVLNEG